MFNNELMADVHFIVGPVGATKKVPAHKVGGVYTFMPFFLSKAVTGLHLWHLDQLLTKRQLYLF